MSHTVLIVDDDITTTRVLEGLLRGAGFETLCAHDLLTAERLALSSPVSLILLDVHLPDGNGLNLCERVVIASGTPVLFISANDDIETKVQGFAAGGVDYITKPLAGAEVLARVRTHLRLRAAYESLVALQAERIQRLASSQQSFMPLPKDLPEARFQVCIRQALRAGGDFYDVIPTGTRVTDYVVADASGHDLGVSLWTAMFKGLLAEYATILHGPPDILRMLDASLRRVLPEGTFFSAIYARLNRASNRLTIANAGHPAAILVPREGSPPRLLEQEGDLIGVFPDPIFGLTETQVRPGDRLFLYSDGLIESGGPRSRGIDLLLAASRDTFALPLDEGLLSMIDILGGGRTPEDDIVLLGVEV